MEEFNVDAFIEGLKKDKSKEKGSGNRLYKVLMNLRDNQGTITVVPFISKVTGNIYKKIEGVKEWWGYTSLIESGEAWYKILPLNYYKGLTPTQLELYNEVVGLFDKAHDTDKFGYMGEGIQRTRNYSLFTGVCLKHKNTEGNTVDDFIDKACLFIFPSNSPIDALETCISAKADLLGPRTQEYIRKIITPSLTNRSGVIQISFKKSASPGYESTVAFETNSEFNEVISPKREFSQETANLFDDPIRNFIGWQYDQDNKSYFNETAFIELRDSIKLALNNLNTPEPTEENLENKNGSNDPMISQPPFPGVKEEEKKKMPF